MVGLKHGGLCVTVRGNERWGEWIESKNRNVHVPTGPMDSHLSHGEELCLHRI